MISETQERQLEELEGERINNDFLKTQVLT